MRVRGKKLLAAMLSLAMVLSMFVVPAAARGEDVTYPEWTFINDGNAAGTDYTTLSLDGLTITGLAEKNGDTHGLKTAETTFTATVPGPCTVTVTVSNSWLVWMDEDAVHKDFDSCYSHQKDSNNKELVFNYTGEAGEVHIHTPNQVANSYIVSIKTSAPAENPTLSLNKSSVVVKMGDTATVTPTVTNGTAGTYTFEYADAGIVTAEEAGGTITLTPDAVGKTTVTVKTTADGTELSETIAVRVLPAQVGTVTANTTYGFGTKAPGGAANKAAAEDNYYSEGLEWSGLPFGNEHGPQGSGSLTVHIPEDKKTTLTVTTCGFGDGGTVTASNEEGALEAAATTSEVNENNDTSPKYGKIITIENAEGTVEITFGSSVYVHSLEVGAFTSTTGEPDPGPEPGPEPEPEPGNGKVDVYDFGAEALDTAKFNNKLTADVINAWFEGVTPGTESKTQGLLPATVTAGKFTFECSKAGTRFRTTNDALTRYDGGNLNKSDVTAGEDPYDPTRTRYTGTIASNGGTFTVKLTAGVGDKLTYIVGEGNGYAFTATFTGADNTTKEADAPASHGSVFTFYAPKTGTQTLSNDGSGNIKPVLARIYVEQPTAVTVSGNVTIDSSLADPTGLKLVFTNDDSGIATEATITGTTYTVSLSNYQAGATYTVTAEGITGGTILEGKALALTGETGETATHNVTVGQVSLVDVSGTVTGLSADALGRLKLALTPPEGNAYVPEITMDGNGAWSAQLQSGVEYTVSVENVNDYTLSTAKVKYSADATDADIAFTAKPTYAVTIVPTGLTLDELADATFTFTNVKETYEAANGKPASYVYTFTGPSAIALRDGQYSVKVTTGKGRQELTPDLKINGAAVNCPIEFDVTVPTVWDFSAPDFTDALYNTAGDKTYNGLLIGNGLKKEGSKAHVQGASGTIRIPVTGDCTVTVFVYYSAAGTVGVGADTVELKTTNSTGGTGTTDPITYNYTGEAGYVDVTVTGTTYITKIETVYSSDVEFKDTVTVGAGKDCATITEALELVAQMPRPNNERVTIVIDPGNYEEQLLVSVANVTLKNAKAAEAKLELKNKGVDIGDNEVRITHYYGHGYTYYSMTNGHRYSEKVLAVNKANGYPSYVNTGSGNTDNSYWNASVLVTASGFQAEGIIFENSFNQYVSAKAANDVIVPQAGAAKEPANAPRASLPQGSTAVQDKTYVERAAALVIKNNVTNVFFDKCAFIGRQDVLAGCAGVTAGFYNCDIYGGTDYIMEDMKAVFAKCNLVMNTSENKNDVAYITAAKNTGGYLMYNCSVISTVPGVNTASKLPSKPGTFGRPWEANCEVVFYETIVDTTTTKADGTQGTEELSLIQPIGWTEGLNGGGNFQRCVEYHTHEGVDVDTSARHANANVFDEPKRSDGSAIDYTTWLGGWNPFADKDMTVLGCPDTSRTVTFKVSTGASVTDLAADGEAKTLDSKSKLVALKEAVITFKIALTEGYNLSSVTGATWDDDSVYTVTADTVVISASRPSSGGGDMVPTGPVGGNKGETVTNPDGSKTTTITDKKGNTTVTTVATDGSKLETVTTKDGDKTITVTDAKGEVQVKIELPATIPAPETKFVDVPESHWAESAINDMAGLGLVKGVNDDSFDMVSPITRASVATILFRLSNGAEGKTSSFTDVKAGEWYADAVAWAASTGVVNGYSETIFAPNDSITREQFAVMLYRFAKLIGMDTATSGDVSKFGDAASVSEWASDAMAWCVGEGILNGTNDPVQGIALSPAKTASRAECAVMLDRFIALI